MGALISLGVFLVLFGFLLFMLAFFDTVPNVAAEIYLVGAGLEILGIAITAYAKRPEVIVE